jgi:S1-C subfamily serine protease
VPSLGSVGPYATLLLAAALGGAAAVGGVALLGGLDDGGTTVVTETAPARTGAAPQQRATGALTVNEIYERAASGVVQITSRSRASDAFSPSLVPRALGSGFVIDKAGHIVTNFHVIEGADEIRVSFSNRDTVEAELVGSDPSTDLALLQVDTNSSALTPLSLADSTKVRVGDDVVAIGNPFGYDRTVTAGIVSAVQRQIRAPVPFIIDHVIQTDAPINQGNSGGPLLNTRAEVIGVNTQIETGNIATGNVGIGFAVPSNTVKDVVAQLLRTGRVDHPYLGISGQPLTADLADTYNLPVESGVLVEDVRAGTGADKAGLQDGDTQVVVAGETYVLGGDIIVGFTGKPIASVEELSEAISEHKPGDKVKVAFYRDGKRSSVTVTLGRRPQSSQG